MPEHLVFFLQCRHRLRQFLQGFGIFACFFLRGKLLGCTMGLSLLGHRELEIEPCEAAPEVVQEFLYTVASWALKTGRDVKPGDLLGLDPQNRHPVVLAPSDVIPGLETLRITLI